MTKILGKALDQITTRLNEENLQLAQLQVRLDTKSYKVNLRTQMSIYTRMLLNCIAYQTCILNDLYALMEKNHNEPVDYDRLIRLFWRQVTIFDSTFTSAYVLEATMNGEDFPEIEPFMKSVDDLVLRAEISEEAQNRTTSRVIYKKSPAGANEKKIANLQSAIRVIFPFMLSLSKVEPGTPISEEYTKFAQRCVDSGLETLGN